MCRLKSKFRSTQHGAALLAFVLVMLMGASYMLVRNFNSNTPKLESDKQASYKLKLAKQALIGYAVTYPDNVNSEEGPGYLPCPDTDGDGDAEGNCSGAAIGRFPWKTLELIDVYDASGQTLWYALSENYRYGPNKLMPLNSETEGQLSVDGADDIVAIIFAPGLPVNGQNRTAGSNIVSHYLEDDNSDGDTVFVSTLASPNTKRIDGVYDANDSLVFNDRLITISRQELMQAVEKRVLGEISQILANYFNTYGAYPWLASFADPKASSRRIEGTADSGSSFTTLVDSSQDFLALNVRADDIVYNITDSSFGYVSVNPLSNSLAVSELLQGDENDFDEGDEYVIITKGRASALSGSSTSNSGALTLEDSPANFSDKLVSVGDILDVVVSNSIVSSGVIDDVSGDEVTVASLSGLPSAFSSGIDYVVRSNFGSATAGSAGLTVEDTNKNFVTMGVQAGDLVWNMSDNSMGRVAAVNDTTLTFGELLFGSDNAFSNNDNYLVVRHDATANTRQGLLALHEVGVPFQTGFQLAWNFTINATDYDLTNANVLQENYMDNYLLSGSRTFTDDDGVCVWSVIDVADCYVYFRDYLSIDGRITSDNNTDRINDSAAQFNTDNIKRGDIAQNYDDEIFVTSGTADTGTGDGGTAGTRLFDAARDFSAYIPYSYLVHNTSTGTRGLISRVIDANTFEVEPYVGSATTAITFNPGDNYTVYQPRNTVVDYIINQNELDTDRYTSYNPDFDTNEYYRIIPAAKSYTGFATDDDDDTLEDTTVDFIAMGVEVGDVVYNWHAGNDWGEIIAVTATTLETDRLYGDHEHFRDGERYTVYYDYVYSREHIFRPRFRGNQSTSVVSEVRTRDVSTNSFNGNSATPLLTVIDYQEDQSTEVGTVTFTPSASTGTLSVNDIKFSLAESSGDLPKWFIKNDWHKLIYIAYSSGDAPGAASVCTAGTNCLTLNGSSLPGNNNRALLIMAGWETETLRDANCNVLGAPVTQDRTTGTMSSYYELDNCNADDVFSISPFADDFNDQVRVMGTSP